MKISWGIGLTIFIIFFLLSTLGVVYYTTTVDVHLVADNYYEKELAFQSKIDKMKRTNKLLENLKINSANKAIELNFPISFDYTKIAGTVYCYYPADEKMDKKYQINLTEGNKLLIPTNNMKKGYWKIEVDWYVENSFYYTEKRVRVR